MKIFAKYKIETTFHGRYVVYKRKFLCWQWEWKENDLQSARKYIEEQIAKDSYKPYVEYW